MRAVQLDFADADFPASLAEVDEPPLPGSEWARVGVTGGGICGSDLHLFEPTTGPTPLLMSYVGMPIQLGHEIAGTVVEAGPGCPLPEGARVAVDPVIACRARGLEPPCDRCRAGQASSCRQLASRAVTPGFSLGFTTGLGGGWADEVLAHHSQLHPVPDAVPTRAETLHEPLSIAVHGILRARPPGGSALVVGAGIVGLCAVVALRRLLPGTDVAVLAKHDHQAEAARACGAHEVVRVGADGSHVEELAALAGSPVVGGGDLTMATAGFPFVVEAVGTPMAVGEALRLVDTRGTVLLLGLAGLAEFDLTPVWFKEATLVGAVNHAHDPVPGDEPGEIVHSVDRALELLASGEVPVEQLVTHEFPLASYREAVATALDKTTGAVKVVLRP